MLSTSSAPAMSAKAAAQDVEATTFFGADHKAVASREAAKSTLSFLWIFIL